ncbi:MAG: TetR/AcrR family transcriptional regulator [Nakamurella sp.]
MAKTSPVGRAAPSTARKRQPPEVRRAMIIDAAREIIAAQGMHATTIRDIASAAGVAVGTVTYHFSGIAEVLAGVLQAEMEQYSAPIMQASAEASSGIAGLRTLTDGLLADGDRATEHWKLWLDFWTLAAHLPHYSDWQSQEVYRDLHALAADLLTRGFDDGSLPGVIDPERQAIEYIALMDGLVIQAYLPGSRLTSVQARALLAGYVDMMAVPPTTT